MCDSGNTFWKLSSPLVSDTTGANGAARDVSSCRRSSISTFAAHADAARDRGREPRSRDFRAAAMQRLPFEIRERNIRQDEEMKCADYPPE
jgi:hypothetical protein